jgi:phosphatidylserine/phosphatidylglycerophosphate/cardiolipin synthase-like enzyme
MLAFTAAKGFDSLEVDERWLLLNSLGVQNAISRILCSVRVGKLWKAQVVPKVKLFGWTVMHQKIMTADNLVARVMQHNNVCPSDSKRPRMLIIS